MEENGGLEVVLPCGHPYQVEGVGVVEITCPDCHTIQMMDLGHRHPSVPDLDLEEIPACPVHGDPLRMWCEDCEEPACGLCTFDKHPMHSHNQGRYSHKLVMAITFISDTRNKLLANTHRLLRQTGQAIGRNEDAFHACEVQLLKLFGENRDLRQLNSSLQALIPVVENSMRVSTLELADKKLRRIQAKAWKCALTYESDIEEDADVAASSRAQRRGEDLDRAMESLGVWVGHGSGAQARLAWDNGRMLVCALSKPSPYPHPVLQLLAVESLGSAEFPEVFLELSVGTTQLGIVYIKLWGHLRRAQNFMLLCMGTIGLSFVGSHLLPPGRSDISSECVGAGMYRDARGELSAMPLLTALEWGGAYQTPVSKGLLVAGSGGRPELDCLYYIITEDGAESGYSPCKFGWVVSGLEYVKEAAHYRPIEQVWVSQCGLVLPRHT